MIDIELPLTWGGLFFLGKRKYQQLILGEILVNTKRAGALDERKRVRTTGTIRIEDANPEKRHPNSIRATIRSIRKYWHSTSMERGLTLSQFVKHFKPMYQAMEELYPGIDAHQGEGLVGVLDRIERNRRNIDFRDLRAISQHVGVPTGVFLMFTQAVGDSTSKRDKSDIVRLLRASQASLGALAEHVENSNDEGCGLHLELTRGELFEYRAELSGLKKASEAFSNVHPSPL